MHQFRRALFVGFALSMIVPSPSLVGKDDPAGKVRGKIQDCERAHRALIVYTKNHPQQAQDAVRETKFFHVVEHERTMDHLLRCLTGDRDCPSLQVTCSAGYLGPPDPRMIGGRNALLPKSFS